MTIEREHRRDKMYSLEMTTLYNIPLGTHDIMNLTLSTVCVAPTPYKSFQCLLSLMNYLYRVIRI